MLHEKTFKLLVNKLVGLFPLLLLLFTLPLFFYKLGQSSLVSWDEAWYAEIAYNIIKSEDILNLTFNSQPYLDHPPGGFWLMATALMILPINEFSVRVVGVISGLIALVLIYKLGCELFNKWVGFASAVALSSALWFVYRSRSGNLDSILTMFFLLTLLLAIKSTQNKKYLIFWALSFSFLALIKTMVPFTIIPTLIIIFWKKVRLKDLILPVVIILIIFGGWFLYQTFSHPTFINKYLSIGLPGVKTDSLFIDNLRLIKEYTHNGIGKWFWPGILSLALSIFLWQRRFILLLVFFLAFLTPFIFSSKGHIWHLIPVHPIMILVTFGFGFVIINKFLKKELLSGIIILTFCFYISFIQIRQMWYQFIDISAYVSDEAILSKEAGKYQGQLYIDGDFVPSAVFYSQKNVQQIRSSELLSLFEEETRSGSFEERIGNDLFVAKEPFLLITYQWRLEENKISPNQYQTLLSDRDKILVQKRI